MIFFEGYTAFTTIHLCPVYFNFVDKRNVLINEEGYTAINITRETRKAYLINFMRFELNIINAETQKFEIVEDEISFWFPKSLVIYDSNEHRNTIYIKSWFLDHPANSKYGIRAYGTYQHDIERILNDDFYTFFTGHHPDKEEIKAFILKQHSIDNK